MKFSCSGRVLSSLSMRALVSMGESMPGAAGGHIAVHAAGAHSIGAVNIPTRSRHIVLVHAFRLILGRNRIAIGIRVRVAGEKGAVSRAASAKSEREARENNRGYIFHLVVGL